MAGVQQQQQWDHRTFLTPRSLDTLSYIWNGLSSMSRTRHYVLLFCSLAGFLFVCIMKREQLLWLVISTAGAAPVLEQGQAAEFTGLRFNLDGTFRISVFEDLHYGEAEDTTWGPAQDAKTTQVINTILSTESWTPNLAILNGDLITGENTHLSNATHYIDQIVSPLISRSIPWASAYGNHDLNYNLSTRALLARENEIGGHLSLTKSMAPGEESVVGTSNYYLPVYGSAKGGNPELAILLWFFDSRGGRAFQKTDGAGQTIQVPGWVDDTVSTWFRTTNSAIRKAYGRIIPSLAFVHIPVYAARAFQDVGVDPQKQPGINDDIVGHQGTTCGAGGECKYTGEDAPFMKALAETEGLTAVFSGHDHGDDWCFKWAAGAKVPYPPTSDGPFVCFGRHTGYGGYGDWSRGARQIVLKEQMLDEKELRTWIRLEDGGVSGSVVLNATYGQDLYAVVKTKQDTGSGS
jgi:hypothetical protein